MTYYVGESFDKEKCKQYKTESGAIKAAEKDSTLLIWNENGDIVDPSEGASDESASEAPAESAPEELDESKPENKVIVPSGKMRVTVICDGSLNIRRSPGWGNNICGRAVNGQTYYVKEIHVVDGKRMIRTIGDLYLSGDLAHVQYEQL